MSYFDAQMQHPDPVVQDAAGLLEQFTQQLQAGEMTEVEYKELTYDLLDMQRIDEMALDLQRKTQIAQAFQQLLQIAGVLGKFI